MVKIWKFPAENEHLNLLNHKYQVVCACYSQNVCHVCAICVSFYFSSLYSPFSLVGHTIWRFWGPSSVCVCVCGTGVSVRPGGPAHCQGQLHSWDGAERGRCGVGHWLLDHSMGGDRKLVSFTKKTSRRAYTIVLYTHNCTQTDLKKVSKRSLTMCHFLSPIAIK